MYLIVLSLFFSLSSSSTITIGGVFDAFTWGIDGRPEVNSIGCQHLAAFTMAFDEVNNKADGISDDLFSDGTQVNLKMSPGQLLIPTNPANSYFDGAASSFLLQGNGDGVVGAVNSSPRLFQTIGSASSLNSYGTLAVLSSTPSSIFNDASTYPMTMQIATTTYAESYTMAALLRQQEWNSIAKFTTSDVIGFDSYSAFSSIGFQVLGDFLLNIGVTDMHEQIDEAIDCGAKVFVFFLDGATAGRLLEQGYNAGLFGDGTQVISTSTADIDDIRSAFTPDGLKNEANILKGFMTMAPHPEYHFNTPKGQSFISRFRNQQATYEVDSVTKKRKCAPKTTITSYFSTWYYTVTQMSSALKSINDQDYCLGFESFQSFNQNGSNIEPLIMYTYDAAYTYLRAANFLRSNGTAVNAANLYQYMVSNEFTDLVTGYSVFIHGRGTRLAGNVMKLLNYQPSTSANAYSKGSLKFIGEYTDATGWTICGTAAGTAAMSAYSLSQCATPLYRNNPATSRPYDKPPARLDRMPEYQRNTLILLSSFGLATLAVWGACLRVFWRAKPIRTAQPRIMVFLLIGGLLGVIKVLIGAGEITQASCLSQLWLAHLSFRLIFRTLLLKLWRINAVVNAASFKRIVIAENTVLKYLLTDLLIMTVVLLIPITIISCTGPNMVGYQASEYDNQITLHAECQVSKSLGVLFLDGLLYFSDAINLVMAIYYTFLTRKVPVSLNETSTVAPVIMITIGYIVVVAVVSYTTHLSSAGRSLLFNSAFLVIVIFGNGLFFGKKIRDIYAARKSGKHSQNIIGKESRNIERSFLELVRHGYGGGGPENEAELLHELVLLIGMLKKAHTPEAKLRMCNDQVTQWKSMLMLISDDLVSSSNDSTAPCNYTVDEEKKNRLMSIFGSDTGDVSCEN